MQSHPAWASHISVLPGDNLQAPHSDWMHSSAHARFCHADTLHTYGLISLSSQTPPPLQPINTPNCSGALKKKSCCVEIFSYCSVHCQCDFFIPLKIAFEVSKDKKRTTAYYVYLLAQLFMQILSATIRAPQLKADVFGWWIICLAAGG